MSTDTAILTLTQWFSPGYPVGAFSYSHGLEWAAEAGDVTCAASLRDWIETALCHGGGRCDAVLLAAAYQAADGAEVARIDAEARAFAPSAERLKETTLQGAAFAKTTADVWGADLPALTYPVAVGRAARLCALPQELTASLFLQAFVANLVAAGQRLAGIGQSDAQAIIKALSPPCAQIAQDTAAGDLDDLSSIAFLADIASMKHETQYSRIFRT